MKFGKIADQILEEVKGGLHSVEEKDVLEFTDAIIHAKKIFCDGKGRSGLQAKAFAMRLAQMGFVSYDTSGVTTPAIGNGDLLIIASGSGETPSLVEHAKKARETGAKIALITTNPQSYIGSVSDCCIRIQAESKTATDKASIQPMGTLFEQSLEMLLDITILILMEKMSISNEKMYQLHNNLE